jgi:hypothetical protein
LFLLLRCYSAQSPDAEDGECELAIISGCPSILQCANASSRILALEPDVISTVEMAFRSPIETLNLPFLRFSIHSFMHSSSGTIRLKVQFPDRTSSFCCSVGTHGVSAFMYSLGALQL